MRMQSIIALAAVMAIAACDAATSPKLAGLNGPGGPSGGTDGGNNATQQLVITPNLVQLKVGTTFQLSTNATAAQQSQIQWSSLSTAIVTVTQAGVVLPPAAVANHPRVIEAYLGEEYVHAPAR